MTAERQLTLDDLVQGLDRFGPRYEALDVFAWHVADLVRVLEGGALGDLRRVAEGKALFEFARKGQTYRIEVRESGIARVWRTPQGALGLSENAMLLGATGAAVGAGAARGPGALLGFLIGAALGTAADAPRKIFSMKYDPDSGQWLGYDGPLADWMRQRVAV